MESTSAGFLLKNTKDCSTFFDSRSWDWQEGPRAGDLWACRAAQARFPSPQEQRRPLPVATTEMSSLSPGLCLRSVVQMPPPPGSLLAVRLTSHRAT